ncbi:MAG: hypothetical protein DID92_2727744338 [Candidatus Nitrotoga sp. SPKER]|nr:MAG: hypothetical protein DID92_2727744338 [Candidatus Nitrotoga sp. SPKER]
MKTIGELRQALEGVPDERLLKAQVIAKDGGAWILNVEFCASVPVGSSMPGGSMAVLKLTHPELETMPEWPAPT